MTEQYALLRDHLTGTCEAGCLYCAKRRRIALEAVADATWRLLEEGGEHPTEVGLHVVSSSDWEQVSNALDALEASGWSPHFGRGGSDV